MLQAGLRGVLLGDIPHTTLNLVLSTSDAATVHPELLHISSHSSYHYQHRAWWVRRVSSQRQTAQAETGNASVLVCLLIIDHPIFGSCCLWKVHSRLA